MASRALPLPPPPHFLSYLPPSLPPSLPLSLPSSLLGPSGRPQPEGPKLRRTSNNDNNRAAFAFTALIRRAFVQQYGVVPYCYYDWTTRLRDDANPTTARPGWALVWAGPRGPCFSRLRLRFGSGFVDCTQPGAPPPVGLVYCANFPRCLVCVDIPLF
ncbi:unnamed protein product [Calypogeia fissa]